MEDRFFFWRNYAEAFERIESYDNRGRLVTAMYQYAFDGVEPDFSHDPLLCMAWTLIADPIRESVENGRKASSSGRRGGRGNTAGKPKRDAKRVPFKGPERDGESIPESTPENVRYGSTLPTDGAYAEATAPPSEERNPMADNLERFMHDLPEPPE